MYSSRNILRLSLSVREPEVAESKQAEEKQAMEEQEEEEEEENEEDGWRLRSTLARAVSVGLMAVTSRSWPDEILRLDRENRRKKEEESRQGGGKQARRERQIGRE